jgi:hypothetical protein
MSIAFPNGCGPLAAPPAPVTDRRRRRLDAPDGF